MSGRSMKMELDGNINIRQNIEEISEKRLKEIKHFNIVTLSVSSKLPTDIG